MKYIIGAILAVTIIILMNFKNSSKEIEEVKEIAKVEKVTVIKKFEGKASYYHKSLHGNKTANGETYNHWGLSAAHKKLKFGTKLRVTNKSNGKQVIVVVNDRGPFVKNRVLDLSGGAAKKLDMYKSGVAQVIIEIIK